MSHITVSERYAPSTDYKSRLSLRLRSGAMAMSRSAIAQTEMLDEVVNVGEGATANFFEQLLARLEQHGVRRCLANRSETDDAVSGRSFDSAEDRNMSRSSRLSSDQLREGVREPYYYMCVPCELRLTDVSTFEATLAMVQDVHYHCSSAQHRHIASWMGEPDIDCTLQTSSQMDPTAYARIFLNGIPMLISSRPGGSDMFFPLPHEVQERERTAPAGMDGLLIATQPKTEVWNLPLRSIYTGTRQLPYSVDKFRCLSTKRWGSMPMKRDRLVIQHIPEDIYKAESFIDGATVPALFEVTRRRLPKDSEDEAEEKGYRVGYVVADRPSMIWSDCMKSGMSCTTVKHDGIYRVALLQATAAANLITEDSQSKPTQTQGEGSTQSQILTVEALNRVSAAPVLQQIHFGLNTLGAGSGSVLSYSDDGYYLSS